MADTWLDTSDDFFVNTSDDMFVDTASAIIIPEVEFLLEAELINILLGISVIIPEVEFLLEAELNTPLLFAYPIIPEVEFLLEADIGAIVLFIYPIIPEVEFLLEAEIGAVVTFSDTNTNIIYLLTLTGAADSTTDYELPMSSFQARKRSGDPTYLSVVVPTLDYSSEISDRSNGNIKVEQAFVVDGDVLQRELILETTLDDIKIYQGGRNQSVVLDGYSTTTYTPKEMTLSTSTYKSVLNGKTTYRLAKPEIFLNPGDTVNIGIDSFEVGVISYTIGETTNQIELTEA